MFKIHHSNKGKTNWPIDQLRCNLNAFGALESGELRHRFGRVTLFWGRAFSKWETFRTLIEVKGDDIFELIIQRGLAPIQFQDDEKNGMPKGRQFETRKGKCAELA